MMKSYDYARRQGARAISWEEFAGLAAQIAEPHPEIVAALAAQQKVLV